jgi:hypothetical protein
MVKEGIIMSEAILDVKKQVNNKPKIKRLELDYKDMNYIIINFEEKVIDVNGELWEYTIDNKTSEMIDNMIWEYENIDEYDYWPDKTNDHAPMSPMWRIAWYDEFDTYYHKSGALKYPKDFMGLVNILKKLK